MENKKLLLSCLMLIPVISAPAALFYARDFVPKDKEWIMLVLVTIPFINFIVAIILILNATGVISFNKNNTIKTNSNQNHLNTSPDTDDLLIVEESKDKDL